MTRTDSIAVALLIVTALAYAGIAGWALVDPEGALAEVGVTTASSSGVVELRAMYGGLQTGIAGFLLYCAAMPDWRRAGMAVSAATVGCLGLVRTVAVLTAWPDSMLLYVFCVMELAGAGACTAWLLWTPPAQRG